MKVFYKRLFCMVIPAAVLAAAGIYAIIQEGRLAREAERLALAAKAEKAAKYVSSKVKERFDKYFVLIESARRENRTALVADLVNSEPFILSGYLWITEDKTSRRYARERGSIEWTSKDFQVNEFLQNREKRFQEFSMSKVGDIKWSRQEGRDGGRVACWMKVSTNEVWLLEVDRLAVLSRMHGWIEECGVDNPRGEGRNGVAAEVCGLSGEVLFPSSIKLEGSSIGEATLEEICMPDWSIRVAWSEGDAIVAGSVARIIIGAGSLLGLCVACFVVGFMMFVKSALAAQKDAMQKTTFVDNVSHELKTPLTAIRLYVDMLMAKKITSEERRAHALEVISSESNRLLRMVESLLDFSRLERGRRTYSLEVVNVGDFVYDTIDMVRTKFEENGISFKSDGNVFAKLDRDAFRQILLNVLDNAAKYAAFAGNVSVSVKRENGRVEVSVEDKGSGLSAEARERVFERFWRGDDSIVTEESGNGLGLSIARHLAEGMSCKLYVSPGEEGGCKFTFETKEVQDV